MLAQIEREHAGAAVIVGDAFARPLVAALQRSQHDVSSLKAIISSGAAIGATTRAELLDCLPHVRLLDVVGSSESGPQAEVVPANDGRRLFKAREGAGILDESRTRVLDPGDEETGWLASTGRIPLGYFGDAAKTAATFSAVDGVRYSVPGDRAHYTPEGTIEVLGRESATINTGGEKVFAEEVEGVVREHPRVHDVLVVGRPHERWGSEIVALVAADDPDDNLTDELLAFCGERLARYKVPKAVLYVPSVPRSPAGKADYRWGADVAAAGVL
jgi:fatty-acyl-CoA synthase